MKNIIYIILLIFIGCSKENDSSNKLVGKWQLIETRIGDGGNSPEWVEVDENSGYFYQLNDDTTFTSNKLNVCGNGNYTFTNEVFTLVYSCENMSSGNPPGTFKEIYYFENSNLIITPDYLNCDEGCLYKFKKVSL